MRGHRFSRDIQELVTRATRLGMDPTVIEVTVTGVSKRQIQWIASEGIRCEIKIVTADGRAREP